VICSPVLGFHRIRHIGLFANSRQKKNIAFARTLLLAQDDTFSTDNSPTEMDKVERNNSNGSIETPYKCPECGAAMVVIELFSHGLQPRACLTIPYFQDAVVGRCPENCDDKPCLCFRPSHQDKEYQLLVMGVLI